MKLKIGLAFLILLLAVVSYFTEQENTLTSNNSSEKDKYEVIKLVLEKAIVEKEIPDYNMIQDKENIVLSTENINPQQVPRIAGVNLILMTPQEIQEKANREEDFLYLRFGDIIQSDSKIVISLDNTWAVKKGSQSRYLSGGGFEIEYEKINGTWKESGEISIWIS
jgi:hypothetical protein